MPPLRAIEQTEFGGVDSRSNPINMPMKRWLRCRNWIPRPDGHLELREGYQVRVLAHEGSGGQEQVEGPGIAVDPTQEMIHDVSAYAAYNRTNFAANFSGTSYTSRALTTVSVDTTKMDDSMNPITPASLSHVGNIHTMVPSYQGNLVGPARYYAHWTPWFHLGGGGGHINIGVSSTDPNWVDSALDDMHRRGFNGLIIDWYGSAHTTNQSTLLVQPRVASRNFVYAIMIDAGGYSTTAQLETHLAYINTQYLGDSNYMHQDGKPVVFFFGVPAGVDYAAAKASVARQMFWVFEGPGAAAWAYADGTFGWPNPWHDGLIAADPYNFAADLSYLNQVSGAGNKPCMPFLCPGFNGTLTKTVAWSVGKYMPRDHGNCWIQRAALVDAHLPPNTFGIQVATWNDWEEGTQIESPIQNDLVLTASITAGAFHWTVTGGLGNETTVSGYRVIAQRGSLGWLVHVEGPGGAKTVDLASNLGFLDGVDYSIYVVALGIASVRNQVSNSVTFNNGAGGGTTTDLAAYSPVAYTIETPAQSEANGLFPNGTRCVFYWQKSAPSRAVTLISNVNYSTKVGPVFATYKVASTARFQQGHKVIVSGVGFAPTGPGTGPLSLNGTFSIQSIGRGTITLLIGTGTNNSGPFQGAGGEMTAVDPTPGPPTPLLAAFIQAGIGATEVPVHPYSNPVVSTANWQYALGKDGYLYMHNGTDAKFFDGAVLRDIGLPIPTPHQLSGVHIVPGFTGPDESAVASANAAWALNSNSHFDYLAEDTLVYYAFLNKALEGQVRNVIAVAETPVTNGFIPPPPTTMPAGGKELELTSLPNPTGSLVPRVGLIGMKGVAVGNPAGAQFLTERAGNPNVPAGFTATLTPGTDASQMTVIITYAPVAGLTLNVGDIIAIDVGSGYPWPSNGPFQIVYKPGASQPNVVEIQVFPGTQVDYNTQGNYVTFAKLLTIPAGSTAASTSVTIIDAYILSTQGVSVSDKGILQMPFVEDMNTRGGLFPPSTVGGTQPGFQFYGAIYNPQTGHVGNRVPLGGRYKNNSASTFILSNLPDMGSAPDDILSSDAYFGFGAPNINGGGNAAPPPTSQRGVTQPIALPSYDNEWLLLIGRTADGGEVPYACIDADGNWITTDPASPTTITITSAGIDNNSELPTENYPPPAFFTFWREGDRICGGLLEQPFVYRSSSELDATTGIFVGNPAQAWSPARVETFPTAEAIVGGFGFMQESWVYTRNDVAQLSELSGEVAWNGPYTQGFGGAGRFCFAKGWNSLPFWVSHDKQLCTMLPGSNGPVSISTEYETALLARIGDDYDAGGNALMNMRKTEVIYFRDPLRLIDVLRIKCLDKDGLPFTVIHDFNLRDDASPYGQGYEEKYLGPLATDYQSIAIRDHWPHPRVWAVASDGAIYQFYTGGLDNTDVVNPMQGYVFTADAIALRYISGERTAVKTIEWYGDEFIQWFLYESLTNVFFDSGSWVNLSFEMRPVPGETGNAHYMVDINRPEMMHCYLWAQLNAHPFDSLSPSTPMMLNDPPHIPLETYGRLYLAAPLLGGTRGR